MQEKLTKTYSVFDALKLILGKKLSFAIYRLPAQEEITLIVQKDHVLQELKNLAEVGEDGGFLIAPFATENGDKTYLLKPDYVFRNSLEAEEFHELESLEIPVLDGTEQIVPREIAKDNYIRQVNDTIDLIREKEYDKVVLSRAKIIRGNYRSELKMIFHLLCASYPNAFVYLFNFNGKCWTGASPEPLVCTHGNELCTVSLASTRPYSRENMDLSNWNTKELQEQEYVTEYIEDILEEYGGTGASKLGPYTKKAGRLLHLRTDFRLPLDRIGEKLPYLVSALHPTSAVCGMPMEKSLRYIKQTESHNREYYAGFLGPMMIDDQLQLFVNLRCMKVLENAVVLYVGGGITSDSVPEDEWEETEIKAETLLSILQQIQ
ncbi:MAG: isochorismate synthase [Bacteroidales bacterium]|nr:isochorismate synthase [Bacteroidales bacterium]